MSDTTYAQYLCTQQYANGANLNARIRIHHLFSTSPVSLPRWIFDQFDLPADASLLEVGCGTGNQWTTNLDRIPPGWKFMLTDLSAGILAEAQENLSGKLPHAEFKIADAQDLPFPDASFDAIVANHMLYHVPDRPKAFGEFRRVLKQGGKLYAATNGKHHMTGLYAMTDRFGLEAASIAKVSFRVSGFSLENGAEQLAPFFKEVRLEPFHDSLKITQAGPLVDYLASILPADVLSENMDKLEAFNEWAQAEIAEKGSINIPKAAGLFIAVR